MLPPLPIGKQCISRNAATPGMQASLVFIMANEEEFMTLPAYAMKTESFPQLYERVLVAALFKPWADALLDRIEPGSVRSLLDVACGTGIVARAVRARLGAAERVVGVDVSEPMLAMARRANPDVEWRLGDAAELPVPAGERFDRVICQQGLQFFTERGRALAEMHRVLEPGGILAVAVWVGTDDAPLYGDLQLIAERHVGPVVDQRHSLGEPRALLDLLARAGFTATTLDTLELNARFPDPAEFLRMNAMALVGMAQAAQGLDEAECARVLATIERESRSAVRPFVVGTELVFPTRANIATARR
jgi:ubiquinone/menaquinone biosynthesis C-methylase UbiE